ncbi:hypothetical protein [Ferrovibrio sp.]|uniref:hypothetical protein n=1 Tax=Ferrovibrio sp. TaxID=1917215 RepID=UPI000CC169B4|nr:hypothetical protein [Ferrovibrio sp.]PJI40404.1 MAG: hypothetical protein CTR53_10360 [Ferrovibrio sp.]
MAPPKADKKLEPRAKLTRQEFEDQFFLEELVKSKDPDIIRLRNSAKRLISVVFRQQISKAWEEYNG